MKLVMTLTPDADAEVLDAQIAYHLNAGVDVVLTPAAASQDAEEALERYVRDGYVVKVSSAGAALADRAVGERGGDWVIDSHAGEFWWPRGEGLKDVLIAIPPRYTIVQALARPFVSRHDGSGSFEDRMTVRRPVEHDLDGEEAAETRLLRPIYRGRPVPVAAARSHCARGIRSRSSSSPRAESRASAKRNCLAALPKRRWSWTSDFAMRCARCAADRASDSRPTG